ncbi:hypothetical protein SARC_09553 [Sphaeroforma arctica JP610]|uniref:Uncharacterized protein n=1 Tax=Sphaeroforma arctica JP610 TaxID=667725 RepID=A0A0L0FMK3_9EUKA|nr:hypothetical protein SARC_09553 [Sphaeroforma arctica JP610]KNC77999.1 hypothetical protein SARC_09553 [Sphaeroforma arctica JP610]|eukprot:XP_014151901.1 hypothetical protein SARC_09553 [Sphaeroforma arctica JP610]
MSTRSPRHLLHGNKSDDFYAWMASSSRAVSSPAFTNLGDNQAEAKEHMLSLYFSPEFYSLVQRDTLPGMRGNHMWCMRVNGGTLVGIRHIQQWRLSQHVRKDPEITFHALDELLTYMAVRALLKVFLAESRDAQTAAATVEFSADNFVASFRDTMVAQNESFLGEPARDRTAVLLAGQRDGDLHTPNDGGRPGHQMRRSDPAATQPDSGMPGTATGGGDAPQTVAEKAHLAKFQQDEAVRQQGSTTESSSTSSSRSLDEIPLVYRASRAVDLAVLCLSTGMHEKVSRFCMVLRNGSNKAYAALAMVDDNISKLLLAQAIAEPALLEKVVIENTQHVLSVSGFAEQGPPRLLSWLQQSWALYCATLFDFFKIEDGIGTKPKHPQNGNNQQAGNGGNQGGRNGNGGGGQQQPTAAQKQMRQSQLNYFIRKARQDRKKQVKEERDENRRSTSRSRSPRERTPENCHTKDKDGRYSKPWKRRGRHSESEDAAAGVPTHALVRTGVGKSIRVRTVVIVGVTSREEVVGVSVHIPSLQSRKGRCIVRSAIILPTRQQNALGMEGRQGRLQQKFRVASEMGRWFLPWLVL